MQDSILSKVSLVFDIEKMKNILIPSTIKVLNRSQNAMTETQKVMTETRKVMTETRKVMTETHKAMTETRKVMIRTRKVMIQNQKVMTLHRKVYTDTHQAKIINYQFYCKSSYFIISRMTLGLNISLKIISNKRSGHLSLQKRSNPLYNAKRYLFCSNVITFINTDNPLVIIF